MEQELEKIQRECIQLSHHDFAFENLVFQSAGLKGIAYAGVYRALELAGATGQLRRVAGCGTGALAAVMVAASLSSADMENEFSGNTPIVLDIEKAACGIISQKREYGWKSAEKISSRLGNVLKKQFGSSNVTFKDVYDHKGIELCIVVANVSRLREEYLHPKTTPNLPVKVAVKMSLAVPGLFKPWKHKLHDTEDFFADGSVVSPYPLHCFDGWYLSMKPEDGFLSRLKPNLKNAESSDRFGKYNLKTIGVVMFGGNDRDTLRRNFEVRDGVLDGSKLSEGPENNLLSDSQRRLKVKEQEIENKEYFESAVKLMQAFTTSQMNMDSRIARKDLDEFISFGNVRSHVDKLFGSGATAKDIFRMVCNGKAKRGTLRDVVQYLEAKVGGIHSWMSGKNSFVIASMEDFNRAVNATTSSMNSEAYLKSSDSGRTIGINTGYIESMDTAIEPADQKFLLLQGMRATLAFLKFWAQNHRTRATGPLHNADVSNKGSNSQQGQVNNAVTFHFESQPHEKQVPGASLGFPNSPMQHMPRPNQSVAVRSSHPNGIAGSRSVFQASVAQRLPRHQKLTSLSAWVNQSYRVRGSHPVQAHSQNQQPLPWNMNASHMTSVVATTPSLAPLMPSHAPVMPSYNPMMPSHVPVMPTNASVMLPHAPVMPANASVMPSRAPVVPANASVMPSHAPVVSANVSVMPPHAPLVPSAPFENHPPHYNGLPEHPPSYDATSPSHLYPSLP